MSLVAAINDPNYINLVSSLLSVAGASLILRYTLSRHRLRKMYNRLVFGIASVDLLYAIHFAVFAMTIREKGRQAGPACTYEGFIHTACVLPSMYYNGFLSMYFVVSIRFTKQRQTLEKLEPYMHLFCLGVPTAVGIINVCFGVYAPGNPNEYSCWIMPVRNIEQVCDSEGNCSDPYSSTTIIAATVMTWFQVLSGFVVFGLLTINSILIYNHARALSKASDVMKSQLTSSSSHEITPSDTNVTKGGKFRRSIRVMRQKMTPSQKNVKQIINQSFLYVGGYAVLYIWVAILNIASAIFPERWGPGSEYLPAQIVRILFDVFYPLSGFYTFLVFFRPRLLRWKSLNKSRSWLFAWRMTLVSLGAPTNVALPSNIEDQSGEFEAETSQISNMPQRVSISSWDDDRVSVKNDDLDEESID